MFICPLRINNQSQPSTTNVDGCFCPYVLGRNRDGELRVLCYQYGGESSSGLARGRSEDNWRCVDLEKLVEVELLGDAWVIPPNYSHHQTCIEMVEAEVNE